jgi:hypothetical protein
MHVAHTAVVQSVFPLITTMSYNVDDLRSEIGVTQDFSRLCMVINQFPGKQTRATYHVEVTIDKSVFLKLCHDTALWVSKDN